MNAFGARLSAARKLKKMSQAALAQAAGVKQGYISELESGQKDNPSVALVTKLESLLEMTAGALSQYLAGAGVPIFMAQPRTEVVREGSFSLPLLGTVPAGTPLEGATEYDEWDFNDELGGEGRFMLRVHGVSMSGVGIHEGDYVIVEHERKCQSGDLVVAKVNGEETVKRLAKSGGLFFLESAHQDYPPIPLRRGDTISIVGRVVGLVRKY